MRYRNTDEDADKKNANTLDHNAYKLNKILYTFIYIFHSSWLIMLNIEESIKEFEAYFQGKPNEVEVVTRTIAVVNKKDQHKNK